eukprot:7689506-Pyramimonas_sp.AAC.1
MANTRINKARRFVSLALEAWAIDTSGKSEGWKHPASRANANRASADWAKSSTSVASTEGRPLAAATPRAHGRAEPEDK